MCKKNTSFIHPLFDCVHSLAETHTHTQFRSMNRTFLKIGKMLFRFVFQIVYAQCTNRIAFSPINAHVMRK